MWFWIASVMTSQLCFTGKQPGGRHTVKFCCWCFFHFWNMVFLCCPGWPWTCDVPASWDHMWYHHTQADYMWPHMSHTTGLKTRTWCSLNLSCVCYAFFSSRFTLWNVEEDRVLRRKKGKSHREVHIPQGNGHHARGGPLCQEDPLRNPSYTRGLRGTKKPTFP